MLLSSQQEVQDIVERLQAHMNLAQTKERLCSWHLSDCPIHAKQWSLLSREAGVRSHERVIKEIKQWESDTKIFQKANTKLMDGKYDSKTIRLSCGCVTI